MKAKMLCYVLIFHFLVADNGNGRAAEDNLVALNYKISTREKQEEKSSQACSIKGSN
jgi:hypothetical protein